MPKLLLTLLVLASSIPAGMLLAYLTSDELKQGKKIFRIIYSVSFICAFVLLVLYLFLANLILLVSGLSLIYLSMLAFISYSFGKK